MLSSMGNYHSGPVGSLQASIQLLAGFENPWRGSACQMAACWVSKLKDRLAHGLLGVYGPIWVQLVSRSHHHYIIPTQLALVMLVIGP